MKYTQCICIECIYILFIQLYVDRHLQHCHILVNVNYAAISNHCSTDYLFKILTLFSLDTYTEMGLLYHMAVLFSIFWELPCSFPYWLHNFRDTTNNVQKFEFLCVLDNTCCYLIFYNSHPKRSEVIFHCGFDLHFPDNW